MSTVLEVAGFVCLAVTAFMLSVVAGFAVCGVSLILIGYATEDQAAAVKFKTVVAAVQYRINMRRARRAVKRADKVPQAVA